MRQVTDADISRAFHLIADLLEIRGGDDAAKAPAYRRAARSIDASEEEMAVLQREGRLRELDGVGEALAKKIAELLESGRLGYLDRLLDGFPVGVLDFIRIPGVGTRTAGVLWRELGLTDVNQLQQAAQSGALRKLSGFGPKKEQAILAGLAAIARDSRRTSLGVARPMGDALALEVGRLPGVERAAVAGSVRRWRETVGDLDLVVATTAPEEVAAALAGQPWVREIVEKTPGLVRLGLDHGLEADIRLVDPSSFTVALVRGTGSAGHVAELKERTHELGLTWAGDELTAPEGERITFESESDLYRRLGLAYIPPELREGSGEVAAAASGELPDLVQLGDIRGDLHAHTDWSDGTASLQTMASAAMDRGYDYLAITDHTQALAMAGGLDEKRARAQQEAIEALNRDLEATRTAREGGVTPFRLLAGVEVDILSGGDLDLPDPVLADFDLVTASIHSGLRQPADKITQRLVAAAKNEHVDVIGHPTGRVVGRREPSDLDLEAIFEAAALTGTMLEMNASPDRLDLNDLNARLAREAGCRFTISTDAHHPRILDDMAYGVATARRAGLTAADVANTLPWDKLRRLLHHS